MAAEIAVEALDRLVDALDEFLVCPLAARLDAPCDDHREGPIRRILADLNRIRHFSPPTLL
jgi:hypothetical protein